MTPSETLREEVGAEREAFLAWMKVVDPDRLVIVDESGITLGMRLAYGYALRGRRALDHAPTRRGRRLSLIGWLDRCDRGSAVRLWDTVKKEQFRRRASDSGAGAGRHRRMGQCEDPWRRGSGSADRGSMGATEETAALQPGLQPD